ncbi:hypothetical protein AB0M54_29845 [Actinoplanes sp. NPDC051470]|uniref:hypothetical protein n=1 Tax=Actinoplanes sp. NPDC051470 TaxID=3157224 RepID=UPI003440220F
MVRKLGEIIQDLIARLRGARGLERGLFREGDGIVRNGKKILMSHDNVLALARKYGIDMEGVNLGIAKFRRGGAQDAAVAAIAGTSALVTSGRPVPAEDCVRPWVVRRRCSAPARSPATPGRPRCECFLRTPGRSDGC